MTTNPEIPYPERFYQNPKWFDMACIDRDTLKHHILHSCAEQATVASAYAEALYWEDEADRQAQLLESRLYISAKEKPHYIINKNEQEVLADGSDDYAKHASRISTEGSRLRAFELLWKRRRVELEKVLGNFDKKSVYLASFSGVLRAELEMQPRVV